MPDDKEKVCNVIFQVFWQDSVSAFSAVSIRLVIKLVSAFCF